MGLAVKVMTPEPAPKQRTTPVSAALGRLLAVIVWDSDRHWLPPDLRRLLMTCGAGIFYERHELYGAPEHYTLASFLARVLVPDSPS